MSLSKKLTTETHLVNLALSKLGSSRVQISDVDTDNGEIFRQVDMFYFPVLEELVRMHTWQCCKKRNELSPFKIKVTIDKAIDSSSTDEIFIVTASSTTTNVNVQYTNYAKYEYFSGSATSLQEAIDQGQRAVVLARQDTDGADVANGYRWNLTYITATGAVINVNGDVTDSYDPSGSYLHGGSGKNITVEKIKPDFNWSCQHFIPTDAIRSFNVIPERNTNGFSRYKIDWVRQGDAILSNYNNAFLTYEGLPTVKEMDALFVSAFTTLLAARLATSLTGSRDLGLSLYNEFNNVIMPEARRVNGFEQNQPTEIDSAWLEATYTSNGLYSGSLPPFSKSSYGSFE